MTKIEKLKVLFLVPGHTLDKFQNNKFSSNPGIGGTEFVTIQLANLLSEINDQLEISIFASAITDKNHELQEVNIRSVVPSSIFDVLICPVAAAKLVSDFKIKAKRLVFVSHHPHDWHPIRIPSNITMVDYVSLGDYQYKSNLLRFRSHYKIANLMPNTVKTPIFSEFTGNFVFLGAMSKAKGFLRVLNIFDDLCRTFPNEEFKLNVVGGDIYNEGRSKYQKEIEDRYKALSASIRGRITFHGMVSSEEKDRILQQSNIAILNPTGFTEAYPASVFECYSYSLPVFGGFDYGMSDAIISDERFNLKRSCALSEYILQIIKDPTTYHNDRELSFGVWQQAQANNCEVVGNWSALLKNELGKSEFQSTNIRIKLRSIVGFVKALIKRGIFRK